MTSDPDTFDVFVSYAHDDNKSLNAKGWITLFVEDLKDQYKKIDGAEELEVFFDKKSIDNLSDWRHRIKDGVSQSRLFLPFISPNYFASQYCRMEWIEWLKQEIAKHIFSKGTAPVYLATVRGFFGDEEIQSVLDSIRDNSDSSVDEALYQEQTKQLINQIPRRQVEDIREFYQDGFEGFQNEAFQDELKKLARDIFRRTQQVKNASKSTSNIPPYNRKFTGRFDQLNDLREQLQNNQTGTVCGLYGLGGIGKTELALTFSHAYAVDYMGGRFLVDCHGYTDIRRAVVQQLGKTKFFRSEIKDTDASYEQKFQALSSSLAEKLEEKGRVLLVLDDVTETDLLTSQNLDHLTSIGPDLHLLITTRAEPSTSSKQLVNWKDLGELTEHSGVRLLKNHRVPEGGAEKETVRMIVNHLGGFPLALELVGAWLSQNESVSYEGFLNRLKKEGLTGLDQISEDTEVRRHNHERRVSVVLEATLKELDKQEYELLEYTSFLPPDCIVVPWLEELMVKKYPRLKHSDPGYPAKLDKIINKLCRLSLLRERSQVNETASANVLLSTHRLIQEKVRHGMSDQRQTNLKRAVKLTVKNRVEKLQKSNDWKNNRWELKPLGSLTNVWEEREYYGRLGLLTIVGGFFDEVAEYSRAVKCYRRALSIFPGEIGGTEIRRSSILNSLGNVLLSRGKLQEAEKNIREALKERKEFYGNNHPEVAQSLNNLANVHCEKDNYQEAEDNYQRALEIWKEYHGVEHELVAHVQNNLGSVFEEREEFEDAEKKYQRALEIYEELYSPEHPRVAVALHNWASVELKNGKLREARKKLKRACNIFESKFGENHPKVAASLDRLGSLEFDSNNYEKAKKKYRRALKIRERIFGKNHPRLANSLVNIGNVLQKNDKYKRAEETYQRALEMLRVEYGSNHSQVASVLTNLGNLLLEQGDYEEAEVRLHSALEVFDQVHETEHSELEKTLHKLATAKYKLEKYPEAQQLLDRVIITRRKLHGSNHPAVAKALSELAKAKNKLDQFNKAQETYREAIKILENSLRANHPYLADVLNDYASVLFMDDQIQVAQEQYRRVVKIREEEFGPEHQSVATALNNVASMLWRRDNLIEAEEKFKRAVIIWSETRGERDPLVAMASHSLAKVLMEQEKFEEAEETFKKAVRIYEEHRGTKRSELESCLEDYSEFLEMTGQSEKAQEVLRERK